MVKTMVYTMVNGRKISSVSTVATRASNKKTAQKTSVAATSGALTGASALSSPRPSTAKAADAPSCGKCGRLICSDTKALQCEKCEGSDNWRCIECLDMKPDMYELLVGNDGRDLHWFCEGCEGALLSASAPLGTAPQATQTSDKRIEEILSLLTQVLNKFVFIETQLSSKADLSSLADLGNHCSALEARLVNVDDRLLNLEAEVSIIRTIVQPSAPLSTPSLHQGGTLAYAQVASLPAVATAPLGMGIPQLDPESQDRQKRKNNVIIYKVPELEQASLVEKRQSDKDFVLSLWGQCIQNSNTG
jgi:hypothetical protein